MPPLTEHQAEWAVLPTEESHRSLISSLLTSARWRQLHLDWIDPLDLLEERPTLLATRRNVAVGSLSCPPELPRVSWLRFIAIKSGNDPHEVWEHLWSAACEILVEMGVDQVASLIFQDWLEPILIDSGFRTTNRVIFLQWEDRNLPRKQRMSEFLRPMLHDDLKAVEALDHKAFAQIWQSSVATLEAALAQSAAASVAEVDGRPVGYQISTLTLEGGHLARVAVDPDWQGQGFGGALVEDSLRQLNRLGARRVTVNTQADNSRSLALYRELGFHMSGQELPIYQLKLQASHYNQEREGTLSLQP